MAILVYFVNGAQQRFDDDYEEVVRQLEADASLLHLKIAGGDTAVLTRGIAWVEPVSDGQPVFDSP